MAKKKRQNQKKIDSAPPIRAPFWNSRRSIIASIAVLVAVWFAQFYAILTGGVNFWDDVILQDFPVRIFSRAAFYQLEFPHWNPFAFNGTPFFAAQVTGVLYPPNILLSLLPVSDETFWYLLEVCIVAHVLIAGITMFVYLRFKNRSYTASVFGAVAFMCGGFLITHLIHTMMVYMAAWFPLILLLFEKSIRDKSFRHAVLGGGLLGITMLAGHPQFTFYEFIFLLSIAAFLLYKIRERLAMRIAITAVFFTVAVGLCCVQYLPTVEFNNLTQRADYTIKDASEGSLQFVQIITALAPKFFGAYTGGSPSTPAFWLEDGFRNGYYNYWETCFYFGISTLILSLFWLRGIKTELSVRAATIWIVGSFCIALGGNFFVYKLLFSLGVPGFTSFRHSARILFFLNVLFPLMAAVTLDSLNCLKSRRLKIASLSICLAAAVIGIVIAVGGLKPLFPHLSAVEARARYATEQGIILIMNAGLFGATLLLFFKNMIHINTAKILIVSCLILDLLTFAVGHHTTSGGGAAQVFKENKIAAAIKNQQSKEIFRFNSRQFAVTPEREIGEQMSLRLMNKNQGTVSGIWTTEGYTPLLIKRYIPPLDTKKFNVVLDLLNVKYYVNPKYQQDELDERDILRTNDSYLPRAELFYKAKVIDLDDMQVADSKEIGDSLVLDYMNGDTYNHHNEVVVVDKKFEKFTGSQSGNGKAYITKYKFNKIEIDVETDTEAILWLSEIWYPAWTATVNGKKAEVYRANYSFRAITVPVGKSKAVFKFNSAWFNVGAIISLLTLLVSVLYICTYKRFERT